MNIRVMAALLAVSMLTVATSSAQARRHYQHQGEIITCGPQGCSDYYKYMDPPTAQFATREVRVRKARVVKRKPAVELRQAMLVDKPQEYIKPEHPGDKLITREAHEAASGSGLVVSHKTGAKARVSPQYAGRFQAYINALEAAGAAVYYMGGIRAGHCSIGSQHPCGWALDVCQDSRGHVSGLRNCHLPPPKEMYAIARANNLYEGSVWCSTDYGHAQVKPSGGNCGARGYIGDGKRHYYASITGAVKTASVEPETRTASAKRVRHHARHRVVSAQATYQTYADNRSYGGDQVYATMDDGSRRGKYKTMKQRRLALMQQRHAAYAF